MQRTLKNHSSVRNAALPVWVIPASTKRIPIPKLYPKHTRQSSSCSKQRENPTIQNQLMLLIKAKIILKANSGQVTWRKEAPVSGTKVV